MDQKSWVSNLGLNRPMGVYSRSGELKVVVTLLHYTIENGVVKLSLSINGNSMIEAGMGTVKLTSEIAFRMHAPVELNQINGCGYSPKVVYRLPKSYVVKRFVPEKKKSLYDRARTHTFEAVSHV
jgi:hypothetical protein